MYVKNRKAKAGYTLIELAIVLSIVGVLATSFIMAYRLYVYNQQEVKTAAHIRDVSTAMVKFFMDNGRYPCPARLDARRGDADYGIEGDCTDNSVAIGTCTNGICIEQSNRTVDIDPNPAVTTLITPRVRRGAVPFRSLGIMEDRQADKYGARLNYAVTEILAVSNTFDKSNGGISINKADGTSIINPPHSAPFVLFSSGRNRMGAYASEGGVISTCDNTIAEGENCNTADDDTATYMFDRTSTANNADYFDDIVRYYSNLEMPMWKVVGALDTDITNIGSENAKIGIAEDSPNHKLDVAGNVATANDLKADEACDPLNTDCMRPEIIAGTDPKMSCLSGAIPGGPYVKEISNNQVTCTNTVEFRCPSGQVMSGIEADGTLICQPISGCPATVVPTCSPATANIPAGAEGATFTTPIAGATFESTYECQSGAWVLLSSTGNCSCTPSAPGATVTQSCNTKPGFWIGPGITYSYTKVCPSGVETFNLINDDCTCDPRVTVQNNACPAGFTGNITTTNEWVCSSPTTGNFLPPVVVNNCVCNGATVNRNRNCPAAFTGTWTQSRTINCATNTWEPWLPVSPPAGACNCVGGTQTQSIGCPAGQIGSINQERTFNCGTNSWSAWSETSNTCAMLVYRWAYKSGPSNTHNSANPTSPLVGSICTTPGATSSCDSPIAGGFNINTCRCE